MNYPNSEMVIIGWFQRKMAPFIDVHSDQLEENRSKTAKTSTTELTFRKPDICRAFLCPGANYSAPHSDTHYLLIYSVYGSTTYCNFYSHVKYSPLASSVRVIYVAFCCYTAPDIQPFFWIKQIQVSKSNNSLNSINCSLSVRLNRLRSYSFSVCTDRSRCV